MPKGMLTLYIWLAPFAAFASPMRYELDLLPGTVQEGEESWDHSINNSTFGCVACHTNINQLGPSGSVSTPTKSGKFALNMLKVKFYGDTANIGTFPNPASAVSALQNTGTAAGYYLYPGRSTLQAPLVDLTPLSSIIQISAGYAHTCALTSVGGALCWGRNYAGQLGNNGNINLALPAAVSGLSTGVKSIAAGYGHTCAITSAGGVMCWGDNPDGRLGNNTTTGSSVPVPVSGLSTGATAITAGWLHSCAITSTGGAVCWGSNASGQLGNGTTASSSVPVPVSGLSTGVKEIAAGAYHTCAITAAGGVVCWGLNAFGQLGNNSSNDSSVPVPVVGLSSGVASLAASGDQTCAITAAGGVVCWGESIGQGSTVPVPVSGLSNGVKRVAAGSGHACAITSAGGVVCWGGNGYGELGNNTTTNSSTPVPVSGLSSGVTVITAGDDDSCAIASGGTPMCWGENFFGELGNNTPATLQGGSSPPLPVLSGVTQTGVYSASIDPAAGLFVSDDATHHSIGIGSGWPNIAPTFPGGILSDSPAQWSIVDSYNLATTLAPVSGHQVVNNLFPTGWPATNTAVPLIGGGTVLIDPQAPTNGAVGTKGIFTATALAPMSAFTPHGGWAGPIANASILVQGTLALATGGNLFTASTDDVVFGFGPYTAVIPAGSFTQSGTSSSFSGNVNGSPAQITLANTSGSTYSFSVAFQNANLSGSTAPVSVDLYVGDNAASGIASPIAQTITFGSLPGSIAIGSTAALSATTSSGLPVSFATQTPSTCTVSGTTVTGVAAGSCTIAANQAGNGIFAAAATVHQSIAVVNSKHPQTIHFAAIHDMPLKERKFRVHARASSRLPVTVSSLTIDVCAVTHRRVHLLDVGTCRLQANQPGNAHFAPAATVERSFKVLRRGD